MFLTEVHLFSKLGICWFGDGGIRQRTLKQNLGIQARPSSVPCVSNSAILPSDHEVNQITSH